MQRHRGLFLGLAMTALLGFMGSQAQAGPIMFSVDLGGTVIFGPTSTVNIATLNSDLAHADSIYRFVTTGGGGLSATSNFPGGATGFLQTTGNITIVAGTNTAALSVDVVQSGFLSPVGPSGTLLSTASGTYVNTTGTTTYTSDFQGTLAAPLAFTQAGSGSFSTTNPPPSMAVGAVPSGYELSNHFVISLAGSPVGASEGFSGEAIVSTVPEPASVVMLVTGMPLPLAIVFGLIRRRKTMAGA